MENGIINGIDISQYQANINYDQVIKYVDFAIVRVGYGVQYLPERQKDKKFEDNYYGLTERIPLGAYYYEYANEIGEGKTEAENCLKYIDGKKFELPIFYDIEDGSISGLSKETITAIAREFVDTIKDAGYQAGIYASKSWLENKIDVAQFNDCEIWCASYGTNDGEIQDKYKYQGRQNIWQYTSRGYVDGISGKVDMNILFDKDSIIPSENNNIPTQPTPVYSGDDLIRNIQQWLSDDYGYELGIDGYYGKETKKYLIMALQHELNVQCNRNLSEDGIFGNNTYNACIIVKQGASGNITKIIQSILYCKGYNTNGIDGIYGKGTTSAVRKFQENQGLDSDGICGRNTFKALCC
jgi:GH25 family lysozyme M1 (1,4-beta-N-acetylmuramidase)